MTKVRIKHGVRPYGGRVVELIYRDAKYALVNVAPYSRPQFERRLLPDTRMYAIDEIEESASETSDLYDLS